ncbi:MAG: hypothetical protein IPM96_04450 [Ignavibacteria bacterium]|nr:hypothetical protein [Ignavibacteria bacterium]
MSVGPNENYFDGLSGIDQIDFSGESAENSRPRNSEDVRRPMRSVLIIKTSAQWICETVLSDSYTDDYIKRVDGQTADVMVQNTSHNNQVTLKST